MGTFFELGKDKAAKGEGWAPPFISCSQDTLGLLPPLPLRPLGYGTPLPFTFYSTVSSASDLRARGPGFNTGYILSFLFLLI